MPHETIPPATKVFTLRVTLDDSDPEIWRRFQIADNMTLGDLHTALQVIMGWQNCHLHEFELRGKRYAEPHPDDAPYGTKTIDEHETFLGDVLKRKGQKLSYMYDFGDGWQHTVVVEGIGELEKGQSYPVCLAGELACPPEDSGALWGYYSKLEIIKNPAHEEHESIRQWMGNDFDPDAFDLDEINEALEDFDELYSYREDDDYEWA